MRILETTLVRQPTHDSSEQGDALAAFPVIHHELRTSDIAWLPLVMILGAIGVVAYADHRVVAFSLIYLYILPLSPAAIFLRRELSYGLIVVCILIHYVDSPRKFSLGLRIFHDLSALLCFAFETEICGLTSFCRETKIPA